MSKHQDLYHALPLRDGHVPTTGRTGSGSTSGSACCLSPSLRPLSSFISLSCSCSLTSGSLVLSHLRILLGLGERKGQCNRLALPCWWVLNVTSLEIVAEKCKAPPAWPVFLGNGNELRLDSGQFVLRGSARALHTF